jgi:FkbM family methyltransferase
MHKERLKNIHNQLQIRHGSFQEELPEQLMVAKYLTGNERVLEIGGNIGRNSLVIAHILNSVGNTNFVSIECDIQSAYMLKDNRELNGLKFFIETRALSKRKLAQKGWRTIVCDNCPSDHVKVNTITIHELIAKYNIKFDTLILDCEGAFYYILKDMPEILDGIVMIIMENDYFDISNKRAIDKILSDKGFRVEYWEHGGWGPCYYNFYEVWRLVGSKIEPLLQSTPELVPQPTPEPIIDVSGKSFKIHIQPIPNLINSDYQPSSIELKQTKKIEDPSIKVNNLKLNPVNPISTDSWRALIQNQALSHQQIKPIHSIFRR